MHPSRTRRLALALSLGLAVTATAACSDDDGSQAAEAAPDTAVTPEACDAYAGLGSAQMGDPAEVAGIVEEFESTAPSGLADDAATVGESFTTVADGGDPATFDEPDHQEAAAAIADAYFAGCDTVAELDVKGVDYGFEGLPEELEAGRVAIRFTNATEHDEPHELLLFRIDDGVTEPVEELLELPEEEAFEKITPVGGVFVDAPGNEAAALLDLEPGRYGAVCFIPIGGGEDGPPHFTGGMVAELEVV